MCVYIGTKKRYGSVYIYICVHVLFHVRSKYVMLDKNVPFVIGISHCVYKTNERLCIIYYDNNNTTNARIIYKYKNIYNGRVCVCVFNFYSWSIVHYSVICTEFRWTSAAAPLINSSGPER